MCNCAFAFLLYGQIATLAIVCSGQSPSSSQGSKKLCRATPSSAGITQAAGWQLETEFLCREMAALGFHPSSLKQ